jgi:hypothetical protein
MPYRVARCAQDLYVRHGSYLESDQDSGETSWRLALRSGAIRYPKWMKIVSEVSAP